MPDRIFSIRINSCSQCPNFDIEDTDYRKGTDKCTKLGRKIRWNNRELKYNIPDDCPLERINNA